MRRDECTEGGVSGTESAATTTSPSGQAVRDVPPLWLGLQSESLFHRLKSVPPGGVSEVCATCWISLGPRDQVLNRNNVISTFLVQLLLLLHIFS